MGAPDVLGTIYFARCGDHVKIGFSIHAAGRLKILQTGSPQPIELLGWMRGPPIVETNLHRRFSKLRVRGEWFRATPALLRYIERATVGGPAPIGRRPPPPEPVGGPERWD